MWLKRLASALETPPVTLNKPQKKKEKKKNKYTQAWIAQRR